MYEKYEGANSVEIALLAVMDERIDLSSVVITR